MKFSPFCFLLFILPSLFAKDWPNFGGPLRSQFSDEVGLKINWGDEEPRKLWQMDVGLGYSSIIEVDGLAYTQGNKDGRNTLYCVHAVTGKIVWKHSYPCEKAPKFFDGGSRATPTIQDGILYLCSHEGDFYALDAKKGTILWTRNLIKDFQGKRPMWGYSGSPLVVSEKMIIETGSPAGSLICLDVKKGSLLWREGKNEAGYASPILNKSNEILIFNEFGLVIHDFKTGKIKKQYQHKTRYGINAAQPLIYGNNVFVSSAYGKGAALIDLTKRVPSAIWESEAYSCQMASLVRKGRYSFGIHGQAGGRSDQSKLFCLDLETGKEKWSEKGFGLGTLVLVRDHLVILSDRGEICLAEAHSEGFIEKARFQVLSGKNNWTPPTYVNGRMHCRSSSGSWVCLKMGQ
ncbi:MAG: PQQ-binding-like beta-propeller repeat protein [Opitutae bacterium]|jgi:outer membrane protein assembly factor BamB|nr:PQQ-binding-like beta-propeller repeat protein [Opitutae bacterium]